MSTQQAASARESLDARSLSVHQQTGFWNFPVGGVGIRASLGISKRHRDDGEPFPMTTFHIDTNPATLVDSEDRALIQLTGSDVRNAQPIRRSLARSLRQLSVTWSGCWTLTTF